MISLILLIAAFVAFAISKLRVLPKAPWMEIGFALAAGAAILELLFP